VDYPTLSKLIYSGLGYLDNYTSLKVFIDSLAELYVMAFTSNQLAAGSKNVIAKNYFFSLGVLMTNSPISSTSTLFQAISVYVALVAHPIYF
jgi:hypothetical protein